MKESKKKDWIYFINLPVIKIMVAALFCILLPVLANKTLQATFNFFEFTEKTNRLVRVIVTTVFLMPYLYYFFFRKVEKRIITELSLKNKGKSIFLSFILAIGIIVIPFIILILTGMIEIQETQIPKDIFIYVFFILGLVIIEEFFFRGIVYRVIENRWGTHLALLFSALVFAFLHLANENTSINSFLSVLAGGLFLGILFTYTKNLWNVIAFHFGWNLSQVFLGFGLSGGNEFSNLYIYKLIVRGNKIISGGISGIENSLIVILILFLLFAAFYIKSKKDKKFIYFRKQDKM